MNDLFKLALGAILVTLNSRGMRMPLLRRRTALAAALCALACPQPGLAQVASPPITLQVDVENFVVYTYDVTDFSSANRRM